MIMDRRLFGTEGPKPSLKINLFRGADYLIIFKKVRSENAKQNI